MKTITVRVLVPDEVDEEYFVQQLAQNSSGPGAPLAAVHVSATAGDYYEYEADVIGRIFTNTTAAAVWHGENIYPHDSET
jgi:hypothetical protein